MSEKESEDGLPAAPGTPLMPWVRPGVVEGLREYVANRYGEAEALEEGPEGVELTELLLGDALAGGATDIHLDPRSDGTMARLRLDGVLMDALLMAEPLALTVRNQVKNLTGLNPLPAQSPQDGHFPMLLGGAPVSVRVTVAPVLRGEKLSLRLLSQPQQPQGLAELGMAPGDLERVERCRHSRVGILAVSGPTGSGKTTTLYALVRGMETAGSNLVSIEDPVESELEQVNQMQVDEPRGVTFPAGLKAMLRLDPDLLILGEIREPESARLAVDAVVSGRRLLCTLHSRDATASVTTLRNLGLSSREIATNLLLVISQRLFRRLCPGCTTREPPTEQEREWYRWVGAEPPERVHHAVGCERCHGRGYQGREGVFEVWELTRDDVALVMDDADEQTLRRHLGERGHRFLLEQGLRRIRDGVTTVDEIARMGGYELGMAAGDGGERPREPSGGEA